LPLYTERKADGIYRYRRRVPKPLVPRIGKGYLYRNLGKTKQEVVGEWPSAHAEIEEILVSALEDKGLKEMRCFYLLLVNAAAGGQKL
jgi:hypothetical protein